jgi:hypothetical protein
VGAAGFSGPHGQRSDWLDPLVVGRLSLIRPGSRFAGRHARMSIWQMTPRITADVTVALVALAPPAS